MMSHLYDSRDNLSPISISESQSHGHVVLCSSMTSLLSIAIENPSDISSIHNSLKIGRRFNYFIRRKDKPDSENSWIPFSEIPSSLFSFLEQFHCRNRYRGSKYPVTPAVGTARDANIGMDNVRAIIQGLSSV